MSNIAISKELSTKLTVVSFISACLAAINALLAGGEIT